MGKQYINYNFKERLTDTLLQHVLNVFVKKECYTVNIIVVRGDFLFSFMFL